MNKSYKREFKEYYVTYSLIIAIVIIYILMANAGGSASYRNLILFGAKINPLIDSGQYWRLFTCVFIHGNFTHLFFNVYSLVVMGKFCENIFGHAKHLFIFVFSGVAGSYVSYLWSPYISIGASGAIFGLLGAIVAYGWNKKIFWRSGLITNLLLVLGINLFLGLASTGIDNYAHLGGLLAGILLGLLFRLIHH
ncbi:MAG: Rhomboid protease GluP [Candidatus Dichloromethanomonas elyunquensis]|nr:MAG: Rhomboid protease GluP [Candidatus Dichloromethanomonas elyunquensis]